MRGKNLIQLIRTLDLLSRPSGVTREEMARELGISIRSVSRVIATVQELGIPAYDDPPGLVRGKRWRVDSATLSRMAGVSLPNISLTFPEIMSLCMLAGESVIFRGTEIGRHIDTAIAKLRHFLPQSTRVELSDLKRVFICKSMGAKTYGDKQEIIQTLIESILDRTACRITYHVFYTDEIKEEDVGPLHFYEYEGGLYVFAVKFKTDDVRTYAVERIFRIRRLERNVTYPEGFDPEKTLNSAFGLTHGDPVSVTIRFSASVARYIREKTRSQKQTIVENPDGSIDLTLDTSGTRDIKSWVMSFGKDAVLLSPKSLRQAIQADLEESLLAMKKI